MATARYFLPNSACLLRKFVTFDNYRLIKKVKNRVNMLLNAKGVRSTQQRASPFSKLHAEYLINLWTKQRKCVLTQKYHRTYFFHKLFEDKTVKSIVTRIKINTKRKCNTIIMSSVSLLAFNWNELRIPETELKNRLDDLKYVEELKQQTLCRKCHKTGNEKNICRCDDFTSPSPSIKHDGWELFIEKSDLVVWRRLGESGHYEYKVYGSYKEVSAEEFLNVQVDTAYRKVWDTTAVVLDVVEVDPDPKSHGDIIYWEMLWPIMFNNRDYVFIRRYLVDYNTKTIVVANKSTTHPKYPEKSDKFRIKDYWSYMVIKPYTELNHNGVEFVLTYYDNPGVNIPSKVTTWVATRAMPEFLQHLRVAAKEYADYCKEFGVNCIKLVETSYEPEEQQESENYLQHFLTSQEDIITDNTIFEAQHNLKNTYEWRKKSEPPQEEQDSEIKEESEKPTDPTTLVSKKGGKSFWRFFRPSYYAS